MRILAILLTCAIALTGCGEPQSYTVHSPDESISVAVSLTESGEPQYAITKGDVEVLKPSRLGMKFTDMNLAEGLRLKTASDVEAVQDDYTMLHGKRRDISYRANQQTFSLVNDKQQQVDVVFRVSNDGVAFRYEFPGTSDAVKKFDAELTSFAFEPSAEAWLQPIAEAKTGYANTNPSYEEHYQTQVPVGTASPSPAGWVFPALFRTQDIWLLITEVNIDGTFHVSRLQPDSAGGEYRIGLPMDAEVFTGRALTAQSALPMKSPWRVIAIGSLATIVESTLGTDVADPAVSDMAFVEPGVASWSWALLKDEATVFDVQKRFIDYAADMDWEYTLIDANWDTQIGYEDTQKLVDYGREKGVGIWLWYNSAGDWNETPQTPKSALLTREARVKEFRRLQEMGVKGLKIDFFGGDGQSMMDYYVAIAKDAADHELMLNYHGSTLPRGMHRTFPNMLTMEAVRGFEMLTFFQDDADKEARHAAMLPFTRNAFDPMDYTPTTFRELPSTQRTTTNGFELALPVLFLSGVQHIAETPEGMATVPDYVKDYLSALPAAWNDSKFVAGFPGKLAVVARRAGDTWYISGINGENTEKSLELDLSFIKSEQGLLINDSDEKYSFEKHLVKAGEKTPVSVRGNGGFVMVFKQ